MAAKPYASSSSNRDLARLLAPARPADKETKEKEEDRSSITETERRLKLQNLLYQHNVHVPPSLFRSAATTKAAAAAVPVHPQKKMWGFQDYVAEENLNISVEREKPLAFESRSSSKAKKSKRRTGATAGAPSPSVEEDVYEVHVMFLKGNERTQTNWINRASAWYQRSDIIHVEIYFHRDHKVFLVNSINNVCFAEAKDYRYEVDNPEKSEWICVALRVSEESYNRMWNFAVSKQGEAFDTLSIYCFLCSCCLAGHREEAWICSRLMCAVLEAGNVSRHLYNKYKYTPQSFLTHLVELEYNPDTVLLVVHQPKAGIVKDEEVVFNCLV